MTVVQRMAVNSLDKFAVMREAKYCRRFMPAGQVRTLHSCLLFINVK